MGNLYVLNSIIYVFKTILWISVQSTFCNDPVFRVQRVVVSHCYFRSY